PGAPRLHPRPLDRKERRTAAALLPSHAARVESPYGEAAQLADIRRRAESRRAPARGVTTGRRGNLMSDRWTRLGRAQLGSLDVDPAREADIVEELAQHVAQQHAELIAAGVDDDEATKQALAPLGELTGSSRLAHEIERIAERRRTIPEPPSAQSGGF